MEEKSCVRRAIFRHDSNFLSTHLLWPALIFACTIVLFSATDLDRAIALHWAFDPRTHRFLGQRTWWANGLIHRGGRDLIWFIAAATALAWLAAGSSTQYQLLPRLRARFAPYRGDLGFALVSLVASIMLIALLKRTTNVDCPWDLQSFGGVHAYLSLFDDRPDWVAHAHCFPGAHSGSGFALFAFYFAFRDSNDRIARWALLCGVVIGSTFAFAQEARGAHFLSHDLWSAFLSWFACLTLYLVREAGAAPPGG
jgi:membrane-associated PAP2 superfamily phosphatase